MEQPGLTLDDLVARTTKLYSLPDIYFRVQAIVDDPDSSMADLANVIGTDPGITARLLRLANSAYFGMATRIDTIAKAVSMLGMHQIHDLVLATVVTKSFSGLPGSITNMEKFWYQSMYCGVFARLLGSACNVLDSERLFVAGLLHDLGHLIMYQGMPEKTLEACQLAAQKGIPLHRAEQVVIGFDYTQAGARLMQAWNLPPSLQEATACQLAPARANNFPFDAAILHIAVQVGASVCNGKGPDQVAVDPHAWLVTGRSPADLEPLFRVAELQSAQVIRLMLPEQDRVA